jgi:AraC-like DNA-binding protein
VQTSNTSASTAHDVAGLVRKADVLRTIPAGNDYRFSRHGLVGEEPVLLGQFETAALRPGLVLYRRRVRDLLDMQTSVTMAPGLQITFLVAGETEISYGTLDLRLGPRQDNHGRVRNQATVVALAEADTFRRRWRCGREETKVSMSLAPAWLDSGAFAESHALDRVREFRHHHLAQQQWEPSARAQALAHQIAHPPAFTAPFRNLYLEARTIEFATEALMVIAREPALAKAPLAAREHRRLRELMAWLDSRAAETLTLDDIAREAAMSPAALQRAFRAFSGQSLFEYLRARRLDAARLALERDGASVAAAAELAGYTSPNNFATAFKRRFGCTPRGTRLRL